MVTLFLLPCVLFYFYYDLRYTGNSMSYNNNEIERLNCSWKNYTNGTKRSKP